VRPDNSFSLSFSYSKTVRQGYGLTDDAPVSGTDIETPATGDAVGYEKRRRLKAIRSFGVCPRNPILFSGCASRRERPAVAFLDAIIRRHPDNAFGGHIWRCPITQERLMSIQKAQSVLFGNRAHIEFWGQTPKLPVALSRSMYSETGSRSHKRSFDVSPQNWCIASPGPRRERPLWRSGPTHFRRGGQHAIRDRFLTKRETGFVWSITDGFTHRGTPRRAFPTMDVERRPR